MIVQFKGAAVDCVYVPSMINDCPVYYVFVLRHFHHMNWNRILVYDRCWNGGIYIQRIIVPRNSKENWC